jgi:hypothetical protein
MNDCICHNPGTFGHTECRRSLWWGLDDLDRWERQARDDETRSRWTEAQMRAKDAAELITVTRRLTIRARAAARIRGFTRAFRAAGV